MKKWGHGPAPLPRSDGLVKGGGRSSDTLSPDPNITGLVSSITTLYIVCFSTMVKFQIMLRILVEMLNTKALS